MTCWSLPFISLGFASTVKLTFVSETLILMSIIYYTIIIWVKANCELFFTSYKYVQRLLIWFGHLYLFTVFIKAGTLY